MNRYLLAALFLAVTWAGVYMKGRNDGDDSGAARVQAQWNQDKLQRAAAQELADKAQQKRFDDQAEAFRNTNIEVSNEHQKIVDQLAADLASARTDVRRAGGLRIPVAGVCTGTAEGAPKAGSDGNHDAAPTGTVALPAQVESDLFDLAGEADRVTEVARECQVWVRKHGFYTQSPVTSSSESP